MYVCDLHGNDVMFIWLYLRIRCECPFIMDKFVVKFRKTDLERRPINELVC